MRSSIATTSSWLRFALMAFALIVFPAVGAYRLTSADPLVQTITDIPLQGYNLADPASSNRTARRAAVFTDGESVRSSFTINPQVFSPDSTSDDTLVLSSEAINSLTPYDLIRVRRTGEIMRVIVAIEDVVTVVRGWAGTTPQSLQAFDHVDIISLNTSFVCWYYCEKESLGASTIWELSARQFGQSTTAIMINRAQSGWSVSSKISGVGGPSMSLPYDPRGKWLLISLAHRNTEFASDEIYLTVRDPETGASTTSVTSDFNAGFSSSLIPDSATIGDRYSIMWGSHRSAPGICIPAITMDCIADGRPGTISMQDIVNGQGLSGHITLHRYEACFWTTNFSAGALGGAGNDARAGVVSGALHTFDSGSLIYPRRHQTDPGRSMRGAIVSVDPYTFGEGSFRIARPFFDSRIDTLIASPASPQSFNELGGLQPRGIVGPKSRRFANAVVNGTISGQLRVAVLGNSRAVFPEVYPLRLSDGSFPGRSVSTNFVNMGLVGQAPLYHNGLIVGHIGPVPWGSWGGRDARVGAYGVDCEDELPFCRSLINQQTVAPSVAMESLLDSTLGSRFGIFSPTATRVPATGYPGSAELGALDHYRGNHAAIRLRNNHSARFMVRPEAGLPATDPLKVTMFILNHPSSSGVTARAVRSLSQGGSEVWSQAISTPALGSASHVPPPTPKPIIAATDAVILSASVPYTRGFIEVDDSDLAFSAIALGDMVQIANPSGSFNTYNEAFIVADITREPTGRLRLSYDWTLKRPPTAGDRATFIKGDDILKKITFEMPPCVDGEWRGIEVAASGSGDGVALWGFGFENPVRNGIITAPIGRSGCGAMMQYMRMPMVAPPLGSSLVRQIFEELDLDVVVLSTADQGTGAGEHVEAYERLLDLFRFESPDSECVLYGTGPEYRLEDHPDKSDLGNKFSVFVAMQLAAARKVVPITSFYASPDFATSAFGRLQSGVDTTEGATHPGTVLDVTLLANQLLSLPAAPPQITPTQAVTCPTGSVSFEVPRSPEPGVGYRWQIEDPSSPEGFTPLNNGPFIRNQRLIATFAGVDTEAVTITDLAGWNLHAWTNGERGRIRCAEIRNGVASISHPVEIAVCITDIDCSGSVDGDDVILFFAAWDFGDPSADLTGDGGVDGDDVIEFFTRWDAGC